MEMQSFSEDLRRYLALLRRWIWLVVAIMGVSGLAAFIISKQSTPIYQAKTTVLVNEAPATKSNDYASLVMSERLTQTYSELMTKQPVLEGVIERLGLGQSAGQLAGAIQADPVRDTTLIDVRVQDTNPERAAQIANAVVLEFTEQNQSLQATRYSASKNNLEEQLLQLDQQIQDTVQQIDEMKNDADRASEKQTLETNLAQYRQTYAYLLQSFEQVRLAEAQSTSNVVQVEPASAPSSPIRPRTLYNTMLAVLIGAVLSIGIVFLIEALDDSLRNPEEAAQELGLPILGMVARYEAENITPVTLTHPRVPVAEAFRIIRTNIQFASVDKTLKTILITSPSPSDGKSTVVANLGVVLAQSGRRVALVDGDLRRPRIHKIMNVPNRQGISDLFMQPQVYLDGSLQKTEAQNLFTLTSGSLPPNPSELLGSEKMSEILRQVGEQSDLAIIDSPPILAVTDASVLAPRVDGVLIVVRPGITKMGALRQAVDQMRHVGANLLGFVLNEVEIKRHSYYNYRGYYYTYYEQYEQYDDLGQLVKRKKAVHKKRETAPTK